MEIYMKILQAEEIFERKKQSISRKSNSNL